MPKPVIRVVSAAIIIDQRYLITQRKPSAVLPLLWEFPGGRVEDGENDATALERELHYRLGVEVEMEQCIKTIHREYTDYIVCLCIYHCKLGSIYPKPLMVHDLRWVTVDEFEDYEFTPADEAAMNALLSEHQLPH